jgi:hypothetical protein
MMATRWRAAVLLSLALDTTMLFSGCDVGTPSMDTSHTEATVSGVVSVKGVPATGGRILFNPSNAGRIVPTRTAPIGPDGTYTIKTLTGVNQVTFDGELAVKNREIGLVKDFAEVTSGENKKDFDLLGEGGGKKVLFRSDPKAKGARSAPSK